MEIFETRGHGEGRLPYFRGETSATEAKKSKTLLGTGSMGSSSGEAHPPALKKLDLCAGPPSNATALPP